MSTGCASINNSPIQPVQIDSSPRNAEFTIVDEHGEQVAQGTTPDTVMLHTSGAPFQAARYFIDYKHKDYPGKTKSLVGKMSVWYLVNLVSSVPGVFGALVIDPYTGTMYNLPTESRVALSNQSTTTRIDIDAAAKKQPNTLPEPVQ